MVNNQQNISDYAIGTFYTPIFTNSQDIKYSLNSIDRDKWVFERLLLDPRYESWFKRRAIKRSLHHTTKIEGNTLREDQVDDILQGEKVQADKKEISEIENCYKAYRFIDNISDDNEIPIDEHTICHINALILGDDDPILTPGQYRKGENYVRHYMTGKRIYTPPNQGDVPSLMRKFSIWLRGEHKDINPVLLAGISHLRLVEIHPFWDGNGRTARSLTTLILQRMGYGFNKLLSLERYFSLDLPNYFNAINTVLGDHFEEGRDVTKWLEYFSEALNVEINIVSDNLVDFRKVLDNWQEAIGGLYSISGRQLDALAYAFLHDGIRPRDYMKHMFISHETARRDLQQLVDIGVLQPKGRGRARKYLYVPKETKA
jgi:Fic family protein